MPATTTVGRLVWHELATTDLDRAVAFYREVFGFGIRIWKPGEADYPMIEFHGTTHGGFQAVSDGLHPNWFGHVHVDDVDAAAARATSLGATVIAGPMEMPEIGRFALVADPYGALFSLYLPSGDAIVAEGVFVWDELLTPDVHTSTRFYCDVVGWTAHELEDAPADGYTVLACADGSDVAGCTLKPDGMPGPSIWITYLATDDVDATAEKAVACGGSIVREPSELRGIGRVALIADPTGAAVGILTASG